MMSENFEVVLANDPWSRHIHYQLRYQVFCLETGYEDPARFPDGEEKDEWDDDAAHFLVKERSSGRWVAAMRLVFPAGRKLPVEQRVSIEDSLRRDQRYCAEISRLCMVGHYRRRLQSRVMPCVDRPADERYDGGGVQSEIGKQQRTAEILQVLLKAAVAVSCERAVGYWYMLTTRSLAKIISYVLPMDMKLAGPACSHRGERYPFLVDVGQVIRGMMDELSDAMPAYRLHSEIAVPMSRVVGGE